jgi:hypothetical protein
VVFMAVVAIIVVVVVLLLLVLLLVLVLVLVLVISVLLATMPRQKNTLCGVVTCLWKWRVHSLLGGRVCSALPSANTSPNRDFRFEVNR